MEIHKILDELPMPLKGEVAKQAFSDLTCDIIFFQDKPSDFLWHFLPKLKQMNFFNGEYLYHQDDSPEEIFFIQGKGKIMLLYDLLEGEVDEQYYIPFNMYSGGSYFGDSDVLHDLDRDGTALVELESNIFTISRKDIQSVLKIYKNTIAKEMYKIANERRRHHKEAIEELK